MQVNVSTIQRRKGASMPVHFVLDDPSSVLDGVEWLEGAPLRLNATVTNTGDCYLVDGAIHADLSLACGRCLRDYQWHLEAPLVERFCRHHGAVDAPGAVGSDEFPDDDDGDDEVHGFEGNTFDLFDVVREQVVVSLPIKRLCSEDCAGICQACGKDLNAGACGCSSQSGDIRMASLAEWFRLQGQEDSE